VGGEVKVDPELRVLESRVMKVRRQLGHTLRLYEA
jgi:hypothetical protein